MNAAIVLNAGSHVFGGPKDDFFLYTSVSMCPVRLIQHIEPDVGVAKNKARILFQCFFGFHEAVKPDRAVFRAH